MNRKYIFIITILFLISGKLFSQDFSVVLPRTMNTESKIPPKWEDLFVWMSKSVVLEELYKFTEINTYLYCSTEFSLSFNSDTTVITLACDNLQSTLKQFTLGEIYEIILNCRPVTSLSECPFEYSITFASKGGKALIGLDMTDRRICFKSSRGTFFGMF